MAAEQSAERLAEMVEEKSGMAAERRMRPLLLRNLCFIRTAFRCLMHSGSVA